MILDLTYPDGDLKSKNLRGGVKNKGGGDLTFGLEFRLEFSLGFDFLLTPSF